MYVCGYALGGGSPLGKVLRDTIKVRGPLSVHDYMSQVGAVHAWLDVCFT